MLRKLIFLICSAIICLMLAKSSWASPSDNDDQDSNEFYEEVLRQVLAQDGWFVIGSYAYKVTRYRRSWLQTRESCKEMGGYLAYQGIRNNTLKREVGRAIIGSRYSEGIWIGLNDRLEESEWIWLDGSRADTIEWDINEPNGFGLENCGEMWDENKKFMINDEGCCDLHQGLCERKIAL
ncbi:C-type lectin domain family 17, member A-like [Clavelina lepadiformis]|uniref:C-type lectin domain-containing protein n=1 Tax=Clavelina lepadiformis TaxID=159417 RepID=A0ABP0H563_CLALP